MSGPDAVWKSPEGGHYRAWPSEQDPAVTMLQAAVYDPGTGQWSTDRAAPVGQVATEVFASYTEVMREPLRDPRITRLAALVTGLLADHEAATGRPPATDAQIRQALEDVAQIPEEARHRRHAAARAASHAGFHRGAGQ